MKVFISSTSEDLKQYRSATFEVILDAQCEAVGMEHFGADPRPIAQLCQEKLAGCDLIILLQAWRWGWVPSVDQGGDGERSITAYEIECAKKLGLPILAFLATDIWPGRSWEMDKIDRVKKFREDLNRAAVLFEYEQDPRLPSLRARVREQLANYRQLLQEAGPDIHKYERQRQSGTLEPESTWRALASRSMASQEDYEGATGMLDTLDWSDQRVTVREALDQIRAADPDTAKAIELCAVPQRFDATLLGILREDADGSANERLIQVLAGLTFVFPSRAGGYLYAQQAGALLIEHWNEEARKAEYDGHNRTLARFYWSKFDESHTQDEGGVAALFVPAAFAVSRLSAGGVSAAPLTEALYHLTRISAEATFDFFKERFDAYLAEDRCAAGEATLTATRSGLTRLQAEGKDRSSDTEVALLGLKLCEARLLRRLQRPESAEKLLGELTDTQLPPSLELEVLKELGDLLLERQQYKRALEAYDKRLSEARRQNAGAWDVAVTHLARGGLFWSVGELPRAIDEITEATRVAGDSSLSIWTRMALCGALRDHGRWDEAWSAASEALRRARSIPGAGVNAHSTVSQGLMSLFAARSPALVDTLFVEARTLLPSNSRRDSLDLSYSYIETLQAGGQLRRTAEQLRGLFSEAGKHPDPRFRIRLILLTGSLRTDEGRIEESVDIYREVLRHELGDEKLAGDRAFALLNLAKMSGERARFRDAKGSNVVELWQQVEKDAQAAQSMLRQSGLERLSTLAQAIVVRAHGGYDDAGAASAQLESLRPGLLGVPDYVGEYHMLRGDLEAQEGHWADAAEHYRRAVELFDTIDRPVPAALGQEAAATADARARGDAISRQGARERRWTLAGIEQYRPTPATLDADQANARGIEILATAGETDKGRLNEARDAFITASTADTAIRWYYTLNLAYANAALQEWGQAADAIDLSIREGPDWWRTKRLLDLAREFRGNQLDDLRSAGQRELAARNLAGAAEAFSAALDVALTLVPASGRVADLSGCVALVEMLSGDRASAVKAFNEALRSYKRDRDDASGWALGRAWSAMVRDAEQYQRLDAQLTAIASSPDMEPAARQEASRARQGLGSDLDHAQTMVQTAREQAFPPVAPIVLELASDLIPADTSVDKWPLFTEHVPAFRARILREVGIEMPGVLVRPGAALAGGEYSVLVNETWNVTGHSRPGSRYCAIAEASLTALGSPPGTVPAMHPVTGESGFWIPDDQCPDVESAGFRCAEPIAFIFEHLEAVVRSNLNELVTLQDIERLIAGWGSIDSPAAAAPAVDARARVTAVVRALLDECVPVTSGADIREVMNALASSGVPDVVAAVRIRLRNELPGNRPLLHQEMLPEEIEETLSTGLKVDHARITSDVPPERAQAALVRVRGWLGTLPPRVAIVVGDARFRPVLRRLIKAEFPNVPVLADKELTGDRFPASAVVAPAEASDGSGN